MASGGRSRACLRLTNFPFSDWWGIFPEDALNSFNWSNLIYWEYLNSGSKRWADYLRNEGNATIVASSPGIVVVALFPNDGYSPWGYTSFTFKPWASCSSNSNCSPLLPAALFRCRLTKRFSFRFVVDCRTGCQNGGVCPNATAVRSYCECPTNFFWKDCSLGCSGVKKLQNATGVFSVGGNKRPLPVSSHGCEWLISPPPPVTSITLSFDYVDFSTSDQLDIFQGDTERADALVLSISGTQLLRAMELNVSQVLIVMRLYSGGQGYAGFQARWATNYIKVNQLVSVGYDHAASITFLVILSVLLLVLLILLVLLAKYRCASRSLGANTRLQRSLLSASWIIRASTPSFLALSCYGAGIGFAALPQFWGTPTVAACALRFWLPSLGWVIMFGCYLIKSWRILKIFNNKKVKPVVITDARLLLIVGVMVAYEVIFLIIWTAVDTPFVVRQPDRLAVDSDFLVCSGNTTIFPILSLFTKAALIIWGVALSLRTRKIVELFSESKYIAVAIYSVTFTSVIFVPLLYILPQFQLLWLVLACVGIVLVFTAPIAVTTVRFVRFFVKYPGGLSDEQVRQMTMSHKMRHGISGSGSRITHTSSPGASTHDSSSHTK